MKSGFTLIELLACLVVIGILAALATPSWRHVVLRSQRTDATAALYALATAQERYRLLHGRYADEAAPAPPEGLGLGLSARGWYALEVEHADETRFTVTARPVEGTAQAADAKCQVMSIDEAGRRGSAPAPVDECWR